MDDEFINDLARKYANVCIFKSDFPHDWDSVYDGFKEGFKTAVRLIETRALAENTPTSKEQLVAPPVSVAVCDVCRIPLIEEPDSFSLYCPKCGKY